MLSKEERKLLEIVNEKKLVRKSELEKLLEKVEDVSVAMVSSLIEKGFVSIISPLGENSFILTAEGIKALKGEQ